MKIDFYGHEFDTNVPIIVGRDLKKMRLKAGVTTSIAAEYLGIKSRKTVENWEADKSTPGINQFMLLCHFFDLAPNEIIAQCLARAKVCNALEDYREIDLDTCGKVG